MARINLLPWRIELKRQRRLEYFSIIGVSMGLTLALLIAVHLGYADRIAYQNERNAFLQAETQKLDKQIAEIQELEKEKRRLVARTKAIEGLQSSRPLVVHILDELVGALPDGVNLTEITQTGASFEIKGVAESNARVSSFMRNIEKSPWLTEPQLEIIQSADESGRRVANFTLRLQQRTPNQPPPPGDDLS
ncbi:MAG: pilus assembly protein PilN [Gammaproteobacteria bacterium]|nr:pilus assembly protein PilN [Gammaproteobacteria bacterium]